MEILEQNESTNTSKDVSKEAVWRVVAENCKGVKFKRRSKVKSLYFDVNAVTVGKITRDR